MVEQFVGELSEKRHEGEISVYDEGEGSTSVVGLECVHVLSN